MFIVLIEPGSLKKINRLEPLLKLRILEKVKALGYFPETRADIKRMRGIDAVYRLRVGEWRILFKVYWETKEIVVFDLDTRGRIY